MKRLMLVIIALFVAVTVQAADFQAQPVVSWDGLQTDGQTENSLPVKINIEADGAIVSTADVNGPVTNYPMPVCTLTAAPNGQTTIAIRAQAIDSAGNASAWSAVYELVLDGEDTLPPGVPVINITVSQ